MDNNDDCLPCLLCRSIHLAFDQLYCNLWGIIAIWWLARGGKTRARTITSAGKRWTRPRPSPRMPKCVLWPPWHAREFGSMLPWIELRQSSFGCRYFLSCLTTTGVCERQIQSERTLTNLCSLCWSHSTSSHWLAWRHLAAKQLASDVSSDAVETWITFKWS